jgi:DNA primase
LEFVISNLGFVSGFEIRISDLFFMATPIDEIKQRLGIEEVISDYLRLQKVGASFKAKCPFHPDNDPSLHISPDKGVWHCFGCNLGGSIFDFVMQIEGVEFAEALRILARRAGVELKAPDPREETKKNRLFRLNELALSYFRAALKQTQGGKEVQKYLKERGLKPETIEKFQLGYAPFGWQGLVNFLIKQGFEKRHIAEAGLAVSQGESFYDRFRARIMFPIFSSTGAVLGFSGRIFEPALPAKERAKDYGKYINSPNTLVFNKSRVLYGLNQAKVAIRKADEVIFVEGQLDAVLSSQAGLENVVASSGTALTPEHLQILKRYTRNLVISFDADSAGELAAKEAIKKALGMGFEIKAVVLPQGQDPADIAAQDAEAWRDLLKNAASVVEYFMQVSLAKHNPASLEGKKKILLEVFEILAAIGSRVEQDYWIRELAEKLEAREEALREELAQFSSPDIAGTPDAVSQQPSFQKDRLYNLQANILSILLKFPLFYKKVKAELKSSDFPEKSFASIYRSFARLPKKGARLSKNIRDYIAGEPDLVNQLLMRGDFYFADKKVALQELSLCLRELKDKQRRLKLEALAVLIRQAEKAQDNAQLKKLYQQFSRLLSAKQSKV